MRGESIGSTAAHRGLGDIVVSSRPYDEYVAMFGLSDRDVLAGPVLDCPGGAGAFAAEARRRRGNVVSVDPAYERGSAEVVAAAQEGLQAGLRYLSDNRASYLWSFFRSPEDLERRRLAALDEFAADFRGPDDRYVVAALPELPFPDRRFRLVLSAYLLFSYPDHFDDDAHLRGLRELVRVAREEVRLYPLIDTAYKRYPSIDALRTTLLAEGVESEIRRVDYAFQRGAGEMLVLVPPARRAGGSQP